MDRVLGAWGVGMSPARALAIRPATAADAPALAAQRVAMFHEMGHTPVAGPEAFERQSAGAFADALERGVCCAWVADSGSALVGSVALLIYPRLPSPALAATQEGYLLNVYTVPEWRGRGVATALVATALAKARALKLARVRLHATAQGQPIYAAAGFIARADEMELTLEAS
ncbi:MAG TPA: GNAT family N-acetyltransferase [Vicinamibacterales bacterium]|nr:GNAT family N-acetyltransferase [Vicinamibacterales bacterium]